MASVTCPKCGEVIPIEQSAFDAAVQSAVSARLDEYAKEQVEAALIHQRETFEAEKIALSNGYEAQILKAKNDVKSESSATIAKLKEENLQLKEEHFNAVSEAVREEATKNAAELGKLKQQIASMETDKAALIQNAKLEVAAEKDKEIAKLTAERAQIEISSSETEKALRAEIDRIKDMKLQLSTKMIGEELEVHCQEEFNKFKLAGCFPNAELIKDNVAIKGEGETKGTKGDFIYRELAEDGSELISIMFEMKNEADDSTHKKTNESHLKKLDEDRKKKNCEFAVLVSTLEPNSDIYNAGIVDVSVLHQEYEKMYVVRPQVFIPIISILRGARLDSIDLHRRISELSANKFDLVTFQNAAMKWVSEADNYFRYNSDQIDSAIKNIDTSIKQLEAAKEALRKAKGHGTNALKKASLSSYDKLMASKASLIESLPDVKN